MEYTITIESRTGKVNFSGVFREGGDGSMSFVTLCDRGGYSEMFSEIIRRGFLEISKTDDGDLDIKTEIPSSPFDIAERLSRDGFIVKCSQGATT